MNIVSNPHNIDLEMKLEGLEIGHSFQVKCHGEDTPRKLHGIFNFSEVTLKRLLDLARQTVVIQYQNSVRPTPESCPNDGDDVDIIVSATGKRAFNPTAFVDKVFDKLSPEQQEQLIQTLMTKVGG